MKQIKIFTLIVAMLSIISTTAHASNVTLGKDASATVISNGQKSTLTPSSSIKKGDEVTVHKGNITLTYGNCQNQSVPALHSVVITDGKACGALKPLGNSAGNVARIDPNTANLPCTNCKAALASKVATTKLLLIGGAIVAGAIIADNKKSSP